MMFKKRIACLLCILLLCAQPVRVQAAEGENLPGGELLIVYSDGASESSLENVDRIVEILTYEGVQVTFAPASRCVGRLSDFAYIIFYEVTDYPSSLQEEVGALEKENASAGSRLLFVGNHFLKEYLDSTHRSASYVLCDGETGRLTYDFGGQNSKQALVSFQELIFLEGEKEYETGSLLAGAKEGYFCGRQGLITHIGVSDLSHPLVWSAFTEEIARWRLKDEQIQRHVQYIVLNKIYPFQSPDKLLEIVKEMAERNMPFVISVMPIYDHGDYPAMQRFCEVLKYAQDNGGAIVLHVPLNQMQNFDVDLVHGALSQAVSAYVQQGVYPMGLQVPENWMANSRTIEVMSRFQTIFVSDESDSRIEDDWKEAESNLVYRDNHQWIAPSKALNSESAGWITAYSTAIYLDVNEDMDQIRQKIEDCDNSFAAFQNLWEVPHSFYTNTVIMSYRNGIVAINGSQVDITFVPTEYEEDFSYNRNQLQRFSRDLTTGNRRLVVAVAAVAALFVIFLVVARRNNRSRFFYEDEDMDEYWANKR